MAEEVFKVVVKIKEFLERKRFLALNLIFAFCLFSLVGCWSLFQKIHPGFYFLPVGEGDSELIITSQGNKILVDGGPPNGDLIMWVDKILPFYDRYIDVVILTHPQVDHFGGFLELLKYYRVGIFVDNGDKNNTISYKQLQDLISEKKLKMVSLSKGDFIFNGKDFLNFLSPTKDEKFSLSEDKNTAALVFKAQVDDLTGIFTSDVDKKTLENISDFVFPVDVLKVPHHGSKYSLDELFFKKASPSFSIIEVGKNSYGHPSKEIVDFLEGINSLVFRTDDGGGVIKVFRGGQKIFVSRLK